jgi:N-acetylglucosamine malate deacetylase 1
MAILWKILDASSNLQYLDRQAVMPIMSRVPLSKFLSSETGTDIGNLMESRSGSQPLSIVCIGAHPDDAECGCGGTLAKLARLGHNVTVLCLTRGEAGIREAAYDAAADIRSVEAKRACDLLGVRVVFANQIDGQTGTDVQRSAEFSRQLASLSPDIVFTHWPLDTHRDHRNAAVLAYEAWQQASESFALVYYEVMAGIQTHHFEPNCFVDISPTFTEKRTAVYAHESQRPARFYPYHEEMEKRRGTEAAVARAEAFFVVRKKLPQPYFAVAV